MKTKLLSIGAALAVLAAVILPVNVRAICGCGSYVQGNYCPFNGTTPPSFWAAWDVLHNVKPWMSWHDPLSVNDGDVIVILWPNGCRSQSGTGQGAVWLFYSKCPYDGIHTDNQPLPVGCRGGKWRVHANCLTGSFYLELIEGYTCDPQ